jgi:hypothetical protein
MKSIPDDKNDKKAKETMKLPMNGQLMHKLSQKITKLKSTAITRAKAKEPFNKAIDAAVGNNVKALVEKHKYIIPYSNDDNLSSVYLIAFGGKYISVYTDYLERWNQLIMKEKGILD